ncbi:MAG: hypothetical protein EZS28_026290 [Streblomastix strix]|uniref:Uncharacterized protein n=1 Tax=Streblomastix strix TaxID=222440 RepID=A0A5J4V6X6_9EUKA|nr:MAG: hypothetical protein EZS28_026290 [Streblomastix strix]
MTRSLIDTTEQGKLLKTQRSPVIRPGYDNQMLRSLRALPQTEEAHPASVDTLIIRIESFTGELDQELMKLTAQQVLDSIRNKLEIMLPKWAQDLARKPTPETQLTAFFNIVKLVTTVEPESLRTTQSFLQLTPSTVNIRTITVIISFPILWTTNAIPDLTNSIPGYSTSESVQQVGQAITQTVEGPRQNETATRSVHNLLIPLISVYPQQQTFRILPLPYTIERNQPQRQIKTSISPTHKKNDESEDDELLDEIIPGITMPHLPSHKIDIEIAE